MRYAKMILTVAVLSMGMVALGCQNTGKSDNAESGAYGYRGAEGQSAGQSDPSQGGPSAHPGADAKGGSLGGGSQAGDSGTVNSNR